MQNVSFTSPGITALLIRTGLGIVFVWASGDKIIQPAAFAEIIKNYQILPASVVPPVAIVLPWIEGLCGLLLISGRLVPGATLVVNLMLFVFILLTGLNLYRGLDINCGCFSVSPDTNRETTWNIVRNSLLLATSSWLLIYTADRSDDRHLDPIQEVHNRAS